MDVNCRLLNIDSSLQQLNLRLDHHDGDWNLCELLSNVGTYYTTVAILIVSLSSLVGEVEDKKSLTAFTPWRYPEMFYWSTCKLIPKLPTARI